MGIEALLARPPQVTRYGRSSSRVPGNARPLAARVWTGTSALLAAVGIAVIAPLPYHSNQEARLDRPAAVAQPAATAATTTTSVPPPTAAVTAAAGAKQMPASEPVRVQIPALGVTSSVMKLGLQQDGSMEVPSGAYPVGWYDRSPTPGEQGPAVLAGHVDWEGEPGAFYGLRELRAGDSIVIDRADGAAVTYAVDRVEEYSKQEFPTQTVYGDVDHAGLRLITCGGTFDEDTGDYQANIVVFAHLTTIL